MKITFDTNVLDLACRPERFPKDARQPQLTKVKDALSIGKYQGFYSVVMLTIEGIMRQDRADVFSGTRVNKTTEAVSSTMNKDLPDDLQAWAADADVDTISVELKVEQPTRKPLHPEVIARLKAAKGLGVKALKSTPRIGGYHIDDPKGEFYLDNGEGDGLSEWLDRIFRVSRDIEKRGVGIAQLKSLGYPLATDPTESWFGALDKAKDIHEERAIERAFSEWADAEAIASHIAYGLDVFCTNDMGNSNASKSILDENNRNWLTSTYGVKFMTFDELISDLD